MLWHMLLFGDAFFGPAYTTFWCFCIQLCSFWGGSNFKKCFQQAITLIFNSVLACCLLFAVCDKWVDFRGGDAVQQCNALLMF